MKTNKILLIIVIVTILIVLIGYMVKSQNISKSDLQVHTSTVDINCIDPEESNFQYTVDKGVTRKQVERIILNDSRMQKIIGSRYCEFMAIGTVYTENGTLQAININVNNTKEVTVVVNLKNSSVASYEIYNLTRNHLVVPWYQAIPPEYIAVVGAVAIGIIVFIYTRLKE